MQLDNSRLEELETKLKLSFTDKRLLNIAITHSSYANQRKNIRVQ